ncbi:hypothetical protein QNO07_06695 [Streptomyces sp. 549]|uniref:hypothetical protein n=1 Tax=Streptomyces sp. 549 TaxID=3049076 RepID=UPI0024C43481|nr:hypothetical protein [Streptomyces sp. 549]MDK1473111.1 hypothetical protein [Streptomyces sp. 549]
MLTASRAGWFAATFVFVLPAMLVMFRDGGDLTRDAWVKSLVFAAIIAAMMSLFLGKGDQ